MHEIRKLLQDYLCGSITPETSKELLELFRQYPELQNITNSLNTEEGLQAALQEYESLFDSTYTIREQENLGRIKATILTEEGDFSRRRIWPIYATVASIIIFLSIGWFTFNQYNNGQKTPLVATENAILPGSDQAVLTTGDGRQLTLSSQYKGIVMNDHIAYDDGKIILDQSAVAANSMLYLATPRGGQYHVVLADGTKVWLNAETKLKYPATFSADKRAVELEGEAYFEVAPNKHKPFIVQTGKEKVEVLGTHFNVNSYKEELYSQVALLEGSVRISIPGQQAKILQPGQQSIVRATTMEIAPVDQNECLAWKNGEFMFNNESLESVMKKLERWYDIDVVLAPELKDLVIWGSVSRYENFETVMEVIKKTDKRIKYKMNGRRIIIMK
ncbi:MAG: DUF4974 domain-containing protein [Sphingobacterium sp.]|jgi:hypothetical protein|nr:DUF4974 domain-containing protein [Sphingobacterium sp.]